MVQIFRTNIAYVSAFLPFVLAIVLIGSKMNFHYQTEIVNELSPLYFITGSVYLPGVVSFVLLVSVLISVALLMGWFFNSQDYMERQTYVPGLIFILCATSVPDFDRLSVMHWMGAPGLLYFMAHTQIRQGVSALQIVIVSGLYLGFISLFYWPVLLLLPISWIHLLVFRPFVWREWFWSVLAPAVIPFNFLIYSFGISHSSFQEIYRIYLPSEISYSIKDMVFVLLAIVIIMLVFAYWNISAGFSKAALRFRKLITATTYCWLYIALIAVCEYLIFKESAMVLVFAGTISIPIAWLYAQMRKPGWADVLPHLLLLIHVFYNWF